MLKNISNSPKFNSNDFDLLRNLSWQNSNYQENVNVNLIAYLNG
jgi:hypothetical protein